MFPRIASLTFWQSDLMTALVIPVCFTLLVSGICSLLEAYILTVTTAEIESLKKDKPRRGLLLEKFKRDLELTSSAILTLNTIAHTLGAMWVATVAARVAGNLVGIITFVMVLGILFLSEILPKNIGVIYRKALLAHLVYPLQLVRWSMYPLSYLAMHSIRLMVDTDGSEEEKEEEEEIKLLAEKHAQDGSLSTSERDMILNALSLNDVQIREIMTPRTVVQALDGHLSVEEVFEDVGILFFGRLPVYEDNIDNIIGLVRRRDILEARANDEDSKRVSDMMSDPIFVPETATAADALQQFLKAHQQCSVVVDEFGATAGVVTMEDIMEHILGKEIYEDTDLAVDMRELARSKAREQASEGDEGHPLPESAPGKMTTKQ